MPPRPGRACCNTDRIASPKTAAPGLAEAPRPVQEFSRHHAAGRLPCWPARSIWSRGFLLLAAGDRFPADARVLHAHAAEVPEAVLTGESQAVAKGPEAVPEMSALAERRSIAFMNTVVTHGRIEAVVTATGMQTEMGKTAGPLEEAAESASRLQVQLRCDQDAHA